jgi:hypothetical protein
MARSPSIGGNTSFIPRAEWLKLSREQCIELLAKRHKERAVQKGSYQTRNITVRHVNLHDTQDLVNLDDIIEYTANTHVVHSDDHGTDACTEESTDTSLPTYLEGSLQVHPLVTLETFLLPMGI